MKIRFGTYTLYENIEMSITEYYGHGLDRELAQNHRIISYPNEYGMINGFRFDELNNLFIKDIFVKELKNAFFITTKGIYQEHEFNVWAYKTETKSLILSTTDREVGEAHQFVQLSDKYIKDVPIAEIEKIWEEIKPSLYDLPIPEGLALRKEIDIPEELL